MMPKERTISPREGQEYLALDHNIRRGRLRNGNSPGDFAAAPRCEAGTRHGTSCQCPAMANGRCRLHGGLSTGARTSKGQERSRRGNWRHGFYSQQPQQLRKEAREVMRETRARLGRLAAEADTRWEWAQGAAA